MASVVPAHFAVHPSILVWWTVFCHAFVCTRARVLMLHDLPLFVVVVVAVSCLRLCSIPATDEAITALTNNGVHVFAFSPGFFNTALDAVVCDVKTKKQSGITRRVYSCQKLRRALLSAHTETETNEHGASYQTENKTGSKRSLNCISTG